MKNTKRESGSSQRNRIIPARTMVVAGFFLCLTGILLAQSTLPVLKIAPTGTNQLLITVSNGVSTESYELWATPELANPSYPWAIKGVGVIGQTNFTVGTSVYPAEFFEALLDTNAIPLWEAADPNNQSTGILNVWIDSPTNGTTLN